MRRLILLRHAHTLRAAPKQEDFDRSLSPRGVLDARLIGRVLAEAKLVPDHALVSAAVRTRQTWEEASKAFGPATVEFQDDLYDADVAHLAAVVEDHEEDEGTLMLVGHNPGIHELAIHLLARAAAGSAVTTRVARKFPTSTALAFTIDEGGRPSYDGLFFVADHGGGADE